MKREIKKIIILRTEHIGDYSLSLPLLRAIREKYPGAIIDVVVGSWNKDFAESTPYIDNVIIFDNPLIKRNISYGDIFKVIFSKERKKILNFTKKLNKNNYDLLISFSDRKFNKIFLKLIKAGEKISGTEFKGDNLDDRKRMKHLLSNHDINILEKNVDLNYSYEDKKTVDKILENIKGKKIIFHPITPLEEKNWQIEKWKILANQIKSEKKEYNIFLVGAKIQEKILEEIKKGKSNIINLAGKLTIPQLILFIDKCDLIIGCDSGPVHLAEITSTPIISLFGQTNEKIWGTPKNKGIFLKKDNINDISVEEVFNNLKKILQKEK